MKIDASLSADLEEVASEAERYERLGYDGVLSYEAAHDPFLPLMLAADRTQSVRLLTSIAVALARSPMTLANLGHDLNSFSRGRFTLGLGSQIAPHITRRFSMPWSSPAARMKELIQALNAIWDCWYDGEPLDFRGDFYTHNLMTPMFTPEDVNYGRPRVALAAVGPLMMQTAASVADGMIIHAFNTESYLRDRIIPTVLSQLEKNGRDRSNFEFIFPGFLVTGDTEESMALRKKAVCKQLAFYGSTPAYRVVFDHHGWGDLQEDLNKMSKAGKWDEMGEIISDDVLVAFAVVAEPHNVAERILERYDGLVDRLGMDLTNVTEDQSAQILEQLNG